MLIQQDKKTGQFFFCYDLCFNSESLQSPALLKKPVIPVDRHNLITNYPMAFNSPNPNHKMPQIEESPNDSQKSKRKSSIDLEEVSKFEPTKIKKPTRQLNGAEKIQ